MTTILTYLREYTTVIDKWLLLFCMVWTAILITLNYTLSIESGMIKGLDSRFQQFAALFGVYCCAFILPYLFINKFAPRALHLSPRQDRGVLRCRKPKTARYADFKNTNYYNAPRGKTTGNCKLNSENNW